LAQAFVGPGFARPFLPRVRWSLRRSMTSQPAELLKTAEGKLNEDKHTEALALAGEALALFRKANNTVGETDALRLVVSASIAKGSLDAAMTTAKDEVAKFKKAKNQQAEASMLLRVAEVNLAMCEGKSSKPYSDTAAMNQAKQQMLQEAQQAASDAQSLSVQCKDPAGKVKSLLVLKDIHLAVGSWSDALNAANEALATAQDLKDNQVLADAWAAVARSQYGCEDRGSAWRSADRARVVYKDLGDKVSEASMLNVVAQIHMDNGRIHEALRVAEQGLVLAREGGSEKLIDILLDQVIKVRADRGDMMEALRLARERLAAVEGKPRETDALKRVVRAQEATGDIVGALILAKDSVKRLMKISDYHGEADMRLTVAQLELATSDPHAAFESVQKAIYMYKKSGSPDGQDAAKKVLSDVRVATGEKPLPSAERTQALSVLDDLVGAFETQDVQAWTEASERLNMGRYISRTDVDEALSASFAKNKDKARHFLMEVADTTNNVLADSIESYLALDQTHSGDKGPSFTMQTSPKLLRYVASRVGGMGFGPRWRPAQDAWCAGTTEMPGQIGVIKLQMSGCELWEEKLTWHTGPIDGGIHMASDPAMALATEKHLKLKEAAKV